MNLAKLVGDPNTSSPVPAESRKLTLPTFPAESKAFKAAKAIAGAAADAGKIGSALVPPVAAAGVLQDKIIEKVKEEISDASAALKNTDFLINQLKALAIETIIALLAIKLASLANGSGKGKDTGDDDLESTQQELDSLVALSEAEESNQNNDGNGGVTTITTTTTSTGTSTSTGGGGY